MFHRGVKLNRYARNEKEQTPTQGLIPAPSCLSPLLKSQLRPDLLLSSLTTVNLVTTLIFPHTLLNADSRSSTVRPFHRLQEGTHDLIAALDLHVCEFLQGFGDDVRVFRCVGGEVHDNLLCLWDDWGGGTDYAGLGGICCCWYGDLHHAQLGDAVYDVFKVSARSVEAVAELLALADEVSALSGVFDSEAAELVGAGGEELFP